MVLSQICRNIMPKLLAYTQDIRRYPMYSKKILDDIERYSMTQKRLDAMRVWPLFTYQSALSNWLVLLLFYIISVVEGNWNRMNNLIKELIDAVDKAIKE